MTTDLQPPLPGDRVTVAAASYPFGVSFLAGAGTVLENRDMRSREREEILIRFDRGVTGVFRSDRLAELLI